MFGRKKLIVRVISKGRGEWVKKVPITAKEIRISDGDTRIIQPDRIFVNRKGHPTIQYPANDAQAWDPFGKAVALTPQEYDEAGRNNYIQQVRGLLGEGLGAYMPWLILGIVFIGALISAVISYQVLDAVQGVGDALRQAHPPPTPTPTQVR